MPKCSAAKTGKHRNFRTTQECPVCGPTTKTATFDNIFSKPPSMGHTARERALWLSQSGDEADLIKAIESRTLSTEEIDRVLLATHCGWGTVQAAYRSPDVNIRNARYIVMDTDTRARTVLAGREDCPEGILDELSYDNSKTVRIAAVKNPSISPRSLINRLLDNESEVVVAAVSNPKFRQSWGGGEPLDSLLRGQNYLAHEARAVLAAGSDCTPEALGECVGDNNYDVSVAAIENPLTPFEAITEFRSGRRGGPTRPGETEAVDAVMRKAMQERLGVDRDNDELYEYLADYRWWEMDENSPEVITGKVMFQNRES